MKNSKESKKDKSPKSKITLPEAMAKLETAYMAATSGEMKFKEVKSVFRKLHKEIKKSTGR